MSGVGWRKHTVTGFAEFVVRCTWTLRVSALCSDGLGDRGICQIAVVGGGWVWILTGLANVVDVKVGDLTQGPLDVVVAYVLRVRAGGIRTATCAILKGRYTRLSVCVEVGIMLRGGDQRVVGVAVAVVDVCFVLEDGVEPAVVDAQRDQVNVLALDFACSDGSVLLFEIVRKLWAIVTTVRLCEYSKFPVLVLGELRIEGL